MVFLYHFVVSERESKYGVFDINPYAAESGDSNTNVVDIKPLLEISSNVTADVQRSAAKSICEELIETNVRIARAFQTFNELMIDTEPLENRINYSEDVDPPTVLAHIMEYLETIVRAYELKTRGISVVAVHPYKKMNDAALQYVDELQNPARRHQFFAFYEWINDVETAYRIVNTRGESF